MNVSFHPRPSREDLLTLTLQVIVRDFPETLDAIRSHGVLPEEFGDRTLRDIIGANELLDGLEASTRWRPEPREA